MFGDVDSMFLTVQSLANVIMMKITIELRIKLIKVYYKNERSNKNIFRALRGIFG